MNSMGAEIFRRLCSLMNPAACNHTWHNVGTQETFIEKLYKWTNVFIETRF